MLFFIAGVGCNADRRRRKDGSKAVSTPFFVSSGMSSMPFLPDKEKTCQTNENASDFPLNPGFR